MGASMINDDDLTKLLAQIPRRPASPAFTDRVLARIDETPRRRRGRNLWAAAAACAVFVGMWLGAELRRERAEQRENAERLELMRDEYRALQFELDELRALAFDAEPVLELGGSEQVDFVIDLRQLGAAQGRARAQPTTHTPR